MLEWKIIVKGKVQGVGYRYSVIDFIFKNKLKLTGYVRNLKERNLVEIVAHGDQESLEQLYQFCLKGPALAKVEDIYLEKMERAEIKESFYKDFKISY